jgi:hypothetical protein
VSLGASTIHCGFVGVRCPPLGTSAPLCAVSRGHDGGHHRAPAATLDGVRAHTPEQLAAALVAVLATGDRETARLLAVAIATLLDPSAEVRVTEEPPRRNRVA